MPQSRRSELIICARQVHADKMRQALTMDVLATDLADYLVRKGVSASDSDTLARVLIAADPLPRNAPHLRTRRRTG